jgi:PKD repeat protein
LKERTKQVALDPHPHYSGILRINRKKAVLLALLMLTATISVSDILGAHTRSVVSGPSAAGLTNCGPPTVITLSQLESLTTASIVPDKTSLTPPCSVISNGVTYPTYVELDRMTIAYAPYTGDCNATVQGYCDVHLEFGCTVSAGCLFEIDQTWFAAGYSYPVNTQGAGSVVPGTVVNATGFLYIDDHGIHELHPTVSVSVYGVPPPPTCSNGAIDPPACATCPSGYVMLNGTCVIQPSPLSTSFTFAPMNPSANTIVTFTATTTGGVPPYTVTWTFGDGSAGTGASIVHTFTSTQAFTVSEEATDSSSPSQNAISSNTVIVLATPPPLSTGFTFLPSFPIVNSPAIFTATTIGGAAPYVYSWDFGDGAKGTGSSISHVYSGSGSYTVSLQVSDSIGLTVSVSTVAHVTPSKSPVLILPGNQTLAVGSTLTFVVNATDPNVAAVIILSATGLPAGATFDSDTRVFYWIPRADQTGSYVMVFSATDRNTPSLQDVKPMGVNVVPASPGGSNGGSGGTNGGANSKCLSCAILPALSSTTGLFVIGGLLGLVASLALVTIRAKSDLEHARRRVKRLTRNE